MLWDALLRAWITYSIRVLEEFECEGVLPECYIELRDIKDIAESTIDYFAYRMDNYQIAKAFVIAYSYNFWYEKKHLVYKAILKYSKELKIKKLVDILKRYEEREIRSKKELISELENIRKEIVNVFKGIAINPYRITTALYNIDTELNREPNTYSSSFNIVAYLFLIDKVSVDGLKIYLQSSTNHRLMDIFEMLAQYIGGMTGLIAIETYEKLHLVPEWARDTVYKIVIDWRRYGLGLDADRMLYFRLKYRSYKTDLLVYAIIVILSAMKERDILGRIIKKYME